MTTKKTYRRRPVKIVTQTVSVMPSDDELRAAGWTQLTDEQRAILDQAAEDKRRREQLKEVEAELRNWLALSEKIARAAQRLGARLKFEVITHTNPIPTPDGKVHQTQTLGAMLVQAPQ